MQSHPFVEHLVAVGRSAVCRTCIHLLSDISMSSYDETVRLFDMRKPRQPLLQMTVGGGVWRIKWHPLAARKNDILAACMHNGFKTLRVADDSESLGSDGNYESPIHFTEHASLAYGVDWSFSSPDSEGRGIVASCSFYDHALRIWKA